MYIRSFSWGQANLSWSVVIEELLFAMENMGHDILFSSTNGYGGMKYWNQEKSTAKEVELRSFLKNGNSFDIDLVYTVPQNFKQRFLDNSKCKMAIYAYESSIMPKQWTKYYPIVDYMLPPSQYCADMMKRNGCPENKIIVVPHGVDINIFNPNVKPININTEKSFKFLCVAEPHYRKQLDKLLEVFCNTFSNNDDVCLVLKTKIFKSGDILKGFEMDLRPKIIELKKKYGAKMPEIKIISNRLENIASLYTACNSFVLMTASEGWGMPFLEALACGLPVVAPRHGGQLEFLNDNNSLLCDVGVRKARVQEQYWEPDSKATVGKPDENHFSELMLKMYNDYDNVKSKFYDNMIATANSFTWESAAKQILNLAQ